eukprot:CAMPEP_0180121784 /NCGR_PEP_ID=MMETSP0986-20121125/3229_1 /TAXON_ID=697907 /ORGANISM="non described non described, Strain CCMP2293" /LENGTH=168 /DNA_ID=CAMNT_0022060933 /DNA_START=389 /DNA_END=893 /DNA_ORIENTATION=-
MQAYAAAMKHSPLLTKAASASVLFGLGDVFAQQQLRPAPFDARRAGSFAAFAALVYAPVQHMWFGWMEAHVAAGRTWAARPMLQAAARVAAHSVVFAPCSIAALFAWTAVESHAAAAHGGVRTGARGAGLGRGVSVLDPDDARHLPLRAARVAGSRHVGLQRGLELVP